MKKRAYSPVWRSKPARALRGRLNAVRSRWLSVTVGMGICVLLAAAVGLLALEVETDRWLELPWAARAGFLAGAACGLGFLIWRLLLVPLGRWPDEVEAALWVEPALPVFSTRYVASMQLAKAQDEGSSEALVRALLAETSALAANQDFRRVVKTSPVKRAARVAVATLLAVAALFVFQGHSSLLFLRRAFLQNDPVPRKTRIVDVTGDRTVLRGEDLKISTRAEGVIPAAGALSVTTASGSRQEFVLERSGSAAATFAQTLHSVQEPLAYSIRLGDAASATFHVRVVVPPGVVAIQSEQEYPAYTRLAPVRRALADLRLLAGSRLRLKIKASDRIQRGAVRLSGTQAGGAATETGERRNGGTETQARIQNLPKNERTSDAGLREEIPLNVDPRDPTELSCTVPIPARGLSGFSVHLVDENGVASSDAVTYPIEIVPDTAPTVTLTAPVRKPDLLTQEGTLLIAFEARDDFGIGKVVLHNKVGTDALSESQVELDLAGDRGAQVAHTFEWKIGAMHPRPAIGSTIEFWLEVMAPMT